jgi:hypothetical protein
MPTQTESPPANESTAIFQSTGPTRVAQPVTAMTTHTHPETKPMSTAAHALALHVGFAGARDLGLTGLPEAAATARFAQLVDKMAETLTGLTQRLRLHAGYFPVGLSQLAVGADSVFADACQRAGILHRLLLPQPRDGFLDAVGSNGPDFDQTQKPAAIRRFSAPNVIQERVASTSPDRRTRFRECSLEIIRLSDVVVTLQPKVTPTGHKPGGTKEFLAAARRHGKVILECQFAFVADGTLDWSVMKTLSKQHSFPQLPALFEQPLPRVGFVDQLKKHASERADALKRQFERRMRAIIVAHVAATALAGAALALSYAFPQKSLAAMVAVTTLLGIEFILLIWGWLTHRRLHVDRDTADWATARLAAELARSADTLGPGVDQVMIDSQPTKIRFAGQHTHLKAFFDLPIPADFRALTRTMNVLHLEATLPNKAAEWRQLRDRYVRERLDTTLTKNRGQIPYFATELDIAERVVRHTHNTFHAAVAIAVLSTLSKLTLPIFEIKLPGVAAMLSWLAIVMPVLAVGVMSVSANLDKEARASTYRDLHDFLSGQRRLLLAAETEPEFLLLQSECEVKLLGETLHWYDRRRFVNPA